MIQFSKFSKVFPGFLTAGLMTAAFGFPVPAFPQLTQPQPDAAPTVQRESARADEEIRSVKIFKHFRFTQGEPLQQLPEPTPVITTEEILRLAESGIGVQGELPSEEEVFKRMEPPEIEKCMEDSTESEELEEKLPPGLESDEAPSFDMLFIDSRDIPENYQEAFGFATVLVPFDASAPNMSWSMVSSLNVPCLPYRMRAQGNRVYYDKGLNALRNFVNGPKGDIDPELKMKFKPDKAKGKKKGG